eukprot:611559_1
MSTDAHFITKSRGLGPLFMDGAIWQQAYVNQDFTKSAEEFENDMAKEHDTVTELLLESLESDDKKFKKIMRNYREKSSASWRKYCGSNGAMLKNQRPTLDTKLDGDCQHILIKYFHPT